MSAAFRVRLEIRKDAEKVEIEVKRKNHKEQKKRQKSEIAQWHQLNTGIFVSLGAGMTETS